MYKERNRNYVLSVKEHVFRVFCQWIKHNYSVRKPIYGGVEYLEHVNLEHGTEIIRIHLSRLARVNRWAYKTLRQTYVDSYYSYLARVWSNIPDIYNRWYSYDPFELRFIEKFGNLRDRIHPFHETNSIIKAINDLKRALKNNGWKYEEQIVKAYGYVEIQVTIKEPPDYDMTLDELDS